MRVLLAAWKFSLLRKHQSYYVGKALSDRGKLHKIICNDGSTPCNHSRYSLQIDPSLIKRPNLIYTLISKLLGKTRRVLTSFQRRYYQEALFDRLAISHIDSQANVLFYDISSGINSVWKAKKMGLFTVVQEQMAHPEFNRNLLEEECRRFNVEYNTECMSTKMIRRRIAVLHQCDTIIALSSSVTQKSLESAGIQHHKIQVVPLGVDSHVFKPRKKRDDKFRVLFIGNGTLIKGVPYLLEAWKRLCLKDAELILCGVQNKHILSRFRNQVDFLVAGVVEARKYYADASIFVLPSLSEGFSRAVLEAMACGLPVIISEGVGARDIIEDGKEGFVAPIKDADAIAERIDYLYNNQEKVVEMGSIARKTAERYTWERYGTSIVDAIERSMK